MNIEFIKPTIKNWYKKDFYIIKYHLNNKQFIHIKNICFERPLSVNYITLLDENDDTNIFFDELDKNTKDCIENLNFYLKFRSTFSKNFICKFVSKEINNIPDLAIDYYFVDSLCNYFIDTSTKLSVEYSKKSRKTISHDVKGDICLGYIFTTNKESFEDFYDINFILNNYEIEFDLWECIFLKNFSEDNIQGKVCIIPLLDNMFDILYCIENNLSSDLEEIVFDIKNDKNKHKLTKTVFLPTFLEDKIEVNYVLRGLYLRKIN